MLKIQDLMCYQTHQSGNRSFIGNVSHLFLIYPANPVSSSVICVTDDCAFGSYGVNSSRLEM